MSEPPVPLARLFAVGYRVLVDGLHEELPRRGWPDVRPAFGFVLLALRDSPVALRDLPGALGTSKQAVSKLVELRGIGRWTAEYTLLRGLGRIDLFPGDDIGARNNLERWMRLRGPLDYARVAHVVSRWKPYGGLIYFHLLLDSIARAELLGEKEVPV